MKTALETRSPLGQAVSRRRAEKAARNPKYAAAVEKYRIAAEVAQRLISYRVEHAMTQSQLAAKLGMTDSIVCRLERGDQPANLETLARLGDVLGFEMQLVDRASVELEPAIGERVMGERLPEHAG